MRSSLGTLCQYLPATLRHSATVKQKLPKKNEENSRSRSERKGNHAYGKKGDESYVPSVELLSSHLGSHSPTSFLLQTSMLAADFCKQLFRSKHLSKIFHPSLPNAHRSLRSSSRRCQTTVKSREQEQETVCEFVKWIEVGKKKLPSRFSLGFRTRKFSSKSSPDSGPELGNGAWTVLAVPRGPVWRARNRGSSEIRRVFGGLKKLQFLLFFCVCGLSSITAY